MTAPDRGRTAAWVGVAGAGLVLGHWLAYAIHSPHEHAREQLLRATGHGYLPYATKLAVLAGILGVASLFLARLTHRAGRRSFVGDAVTLAAVQTSAFAAMEVGERLLSGASLHDLTHGPLLAIGLAVQLALALAGALVLRLTDRAAQAAEQLRGAVPPRERALLVAVPIGPSLAARRRAFRAGGSRAPPSLP